MKSTQFRKNLLIFTAACGLLMLFALVSQHEVYDRLVDQMRSLQANTAGDSVELVEQGAADPKVYLFGFEAGSFRFGHQQHVPEYIDLMQIIYQNDCHLYQIDVFSAASGLTVPAVGTIQAEPNQLAKSGQEQRMVAMSSQPRTAESNVTGRLPHDRFFEPELLAFTIHCNWYQPDLDPGDQVIFETMRNPTMDSLTIGRLYVVRTSEDQDGVQVMGRLRRKSGRYFWLECGFGMRFPFALDDLEQIAVAVRRFIDLNKKADASAREDATLLGGRGINVGREVTGPVTNG